MTEDEDTRSEAKIHRLDTRAARLAEGVRAVYGHVLDEPVPPGIAALSSELEEALRAAVREAALAGEDAPAKSVRPGTNGT